MFVLFQTLNEDTLKFTIENRYILLKKVLRSPLPLEIHILLGKVDLLCLGINKIMSTKAVDEENRTSFGNDILQVHHKNSINMKSHL